MFKTILLVLGINSVITANTLNLQEIARTDFHNNIPDELNNDRFLSFWTNNCRRVINKIDNKEYIGINNECVLSLNDLYCSGVNSTRESCIELNYGLDLYDADYDTLTLSKNYPKQNELSIRALPLIPFVLVFYIAPAAIQIIGEITLTILEQRAQERRNRDLYYNQVVHMTYNNENIRSILRSNFCITHNGLSQSITMNDCGTNNINQRFTSVLVDSNQRIYQIKNNNGLCLDVEWGLRSNGARIIFFTCNNQQNQQWVRDIANRFHPMHAFDKCLDIERRSSSNGANIILWNCDNYASNQKWT